MYDVFISYKREDREVAKKLAEAFASRGLKVWWDIELLPGEKFATEIESIIRKSSSTVVLWSHNAISSDYVRGEAEIARTQSRLIPLRIDDVIPPLPFNQLHTTDISGWNGRPDDHLLNQVYSAVEAAAGHSAEPVGESEQIETLLEASSEEAQFWKAVSTNPNQSVHEYNLYLEKYGREAVFFDLARARIKSIQASKKPKLSGLVAGAIAVLTLILLSAQVLDLLPDKGDEHYSASNGALVPPELGTFVLDETFDQRGFVKAHVIVVTKQAPILSDDTMLIANEFQFESGARLAGNRLSIIGNTVSGGYISASGLREGLHGGSLLVVARELKGTRIESNGMRGENGEAGQPGEAGAAGANGRDGDCAGFGGWKAAQQGGQGGRGADGSPGQNGEDGGDAGEIIVLTAGAPNIEIFAMGGTGGVGGPGGAGGPGGPGGQGGDGCTGLGGTQPTKANGNIGQSGVSGATGLPGLRGANSEPRIEHIEFSPVVEIVSSNSDSSTIKQALGEEFELL